MELLKRINIFVFYLVIVKQKLKTKQLKNFAPPTYMTTYQELVLQQHNANKDILQK